MKKRSNHSQSIHIMNQSKIVLLSIFALVALIMFINTAQAIPAFARKHQTECSSCHNAWPALNATGRKFKENGYRFSRDEKPGFMNWDQTLPVTAMIKSRPYEKSDNGEKKLRALHEVEVMVAGAMANNFSGWFEMEAEDDAGFDVEVKSAALGYHPHDAFNVQVSWGSITGSDPYDVYSNARKLTRNRASVINQRFGGADANGRLRDARQNITLYGRPIDQLFYSVSISGVKGDTEGEDSDALTGRLAFDVTPEVMVGLTAISGTCKSTNTNCDTDRNFTRTSLDAQADIGNVRILGVYLKATDDNSGATAEEDNNAIYVEARYAFMKNGRPTFVPLLRLDSYEKNNGQDDYDEITLQAGYYFAENARGFVEYQDVSGPVAALDDSLLTLQAEVAF